MVPIELPYRPNPLNRPRVLVALKGPALLIPFVMLVDSGADVSVVPWGLGRRLGFHEAEGEATLSIRGIGGNVEARRRSLDVSFGTSGALEIPVLWAALETPPILGRKGIFDRFRVEFDECSQVIHFR